MAMKGKDHYLGHDELIEHFNEAAQGDATHLIKFTYTGWTEASGFGLDAGIGFIEDTVAVNLSDQASLKTAFREIMNRKLADPIDYRANEITIYPLRDDAAHTLDYSLADDLKTKDLPDGAQRLVKIIEDRLAYEQKGGIAKAFSRKPAI